MKIGASGVNAECSKTRGRGLWKVAALALATLPLGAVGGCGAARPMQYYQLTVPSEMSQVERNASGVSLTVVPLFSSTLYREDRIVYSTGPEQMGVYEYHRWTEPPTEMIHEVVLRELRASGRYRAVFSRRSSGRADYLLRGQLYDFKEISGPPLMARLTADWELVDTKTGTVVWTFHYGHDEAVSSKDVQAVVAALDHDVQRAVGEVKAGLEQYFATATTPASTPGK
ncbi:MAG TPA: ABC-type transport auxiliary lipoprotein family protein [Candidatus Acidoferrum sp.]|jgi:ABC-type uncharacterized transport system auxiliary subunit